MIKNFLLGHSCYLVRSVKIQKSTLLYLMASTNQLLRPLHHLAQDVQAPTQFQRGRDAVPYQDLKFLLLSMLLNVHVACWFLQYELNLTISDSCSAIPMEFIAHVVPIDLVLNVHPTLHGSGTDTE